MALSCPRRAPIIDYQIDRSDCRDSRATWREQRVVQTGAVFAHRNGGVSEQQELFTPGHRLGFEYGEAVLVRDLGQLELIHARASKAMRPFGKLPRNEDPSLLVRDSVNAQLFIEEIVQQLSRKGVEPVGPHTSVGRIASRNRKTSDSGSKKLNLAGPNREMLAEDFEEPTGCMSIEQHAAPNL